LVPVTGENTQRSPTQIAERVTTAKRTIKGSSCEIGVRQYGQEHNDISFARSTGSRSTIAAKAPCLP
jgi:hypothetical protein